MPMESHLSPAGKDTYGIARFVRYLLKLIMITEIFQFSEQSSRHCKWPFWPSQKKVPIDFVICQTSQMLTFPQFVKTANNNNNN